MAAVVIDASATQLKAVFNAKNSAFIDLVHKLTDPWATDAKFTAMVKGLTSILNPSGTNALATKGVQAAHNDIIAAIDSISSYVRTL